MTKPGLVRWLASAAAAAVAVGAIVLPATPANADSLPVQISNISSYLCLSPAGGSNSPNAEIVQYRCDFNAARMWVFAPFPGGGHYIKNVQSGLCLSPAGGSAALNMWIVQYYCDTNPVRSWEFPYSNADQTTMYVINRSTHLCLSPAGGSSGLNVTIVQYYCDNNLARSYTWHI